MPTNSLITAVLRCCLITLLLSAPLQAIQAETLVIAQLSDRPKKDYKQLRPMVEAIASRLKAQGITGGNVALFADRSSLVAALKAGKVHWVTETPYTASVLVHEAGARPLLQKWKSGQRRYQSLIYTRKDSDIKTLADLSGKRIAFEHPQSFSSYYLPRILLESNNLQLYNLRGQHSLATDQQLGYQFSRNEKNNLLWVHKRLVDAGVLNNNDWQNSSRVPTKLKSDLRIIHRSKPYPRALELVAPHVTEDLAAALKRELLAMTVETDKYLLARYEGTTGFEQVGEEVTELLAEIYRKSRQWQSQ
ncbi:MAG: phosphate/phosphite/phosphonate ABC transporter substrate-binding protein [Motiliproteus sp.]|nr:phosphate/phosphite/phosphonate ABC transporter substrate-binding protein [Motiliproteus sp.]